MSQPLLSVRDLHVRFRTPTGVLNAVDGISFDVYPGETLAIVGESASGKSVTVESITRLLPTPPAELEGEITFDGHSILESPPRELRRLRGARIGHVFQDPTGSLNPVYTVGSQIAEAVTAHRSLGREQTRTRVIELLEAVGIGDPPSRIDAYPHELSGGQQQRVAIAMALAGEPDLLIADEPTTALDVTIEAQLLELFGSLQERFGMAIVFVTHDLGVVAEIADRVLVCYAGTIVERASVYDCFERPAHPYTQALFECVPDPETPATPIGGTLPDPRAPPAGCRFADRCPHAIDDCRSERPPLVPVEHPAGTTDQVAACLFYRDGYDSSVVADRRGDTGPVGDRR